MEPTKFIWDPHDLVGPMWILTNQKECVGKCVLECVLLTFLLFLSWIQFLKLEQGFYIIKDDLEFELWQLEIKEKKKRYLSIFYSAFLWKPCAMDLISPHKGRCCSNIVDMNYREPNKLGKNLWPDDLPIRSGQCLTL